MLTKKPKKIAWQRFWKTVPSEYDIEHLVNQMTARFGADPATPGVVPVGGPTDVLNGGGQPPPAEKGVPQEGDTAINPTTGERLIFKDGTWQRFPDVGNKTNAPAIVENPASIVPAPFKRTSGLDLGVKRF